MLCFSFLCLTAFRRYDICHAPAQGIVVWFTMGSHGTVERGDRFVCSAPYYLVSRCNDVLLLCIISRRSVCAAKPCQANLFHVYL